MKLLIVGLDGADYQHVTQFMGNLPTLSGLRSSGVFGMLRSVDFPTSPAAWCSVYTGCKPEEHGIEGFRSDGIATLRRPPFWDFLDCKVGLMNLPCVSARRDEALDGFIVPGFSAPFDVHPPRLSLGRYIVDTTQHQRGRLRWLLRGPKRLTDGVKKAQVEFLRFNREVEKAKVDKAITLARFFDVDVLFIGLMMVDRVGHGFAHHEATMLDVYRTLDRQIGRLADALDPEYVIVFSDHGMDVAESDRIPQSVRENEAKALRKNPHKLNPRGLHTCEGILFVSGPGVRRGVGITGARLWDIAPTVLWLFNREMLDSMTGSILEEIFYQREDQSLLTSLEALGYV